jgi:hypothetical protein
MGGARVEERKWIIDRGMSGSREEDDHDHDHHHDHHQEDHRQEEVVCVPGSSHIHNEMDNFKQDMPSDTMYHKMMTKMITFKI